MHAPLFGRKSRRARFYENAEYSAVINSRKRHHANFSDSIRQLKLLNQLRCRVRDKQYRLQTERAYFDWARWYIRFCSFAIP